MYVWSLDSFRWRRWCQSWSLAWGAGVTSIFGFFALSVDWNANSDDLISGTFIFLGAWAVVDFSAFQQKVLGGRRRCLAGTFAGASARLRHIRELLAFPHGSPPRLHSALDIGINFSIF